MTDYAVKLIRAEHVLSVDNQLRSVRVTRVTIQVGSLGTFSKDFPEGQDSAEQINTWKRETQQKLMDIGS